MCRILFFLLIMSACFILSGCPAPDSDDISSSADKLTESQSDQPAGMPEVDDEAITASDGSVLLRIDDIPGSIRVDQETEFGASERIREASIAPDHDWFAVVTAGAAHSAGWLIREGTRKPLPASFQYGGSMTIGPWSKDSQFVVFVHEGPAGDRTLTVVDRNRAGEVAEESAMPVRLPDHDEREPEERIYDVLTWQNSELLFRVGEERWLFDAKTGDVLPEE